MTKIQETRAETITITTSIQKAVVVIKKWITGGERSKINAVMMNAVEVNPQTMQQVMSKVGDATIEQTNAELLAFVVSVNGETENIIESIEDLHEDDYNEVVAAVKKK